MTINNFQKKYLCNIKNTSNFLIIKDLFYTITIDKKTHIFEFSNMSDFTYFDKDFFVDLINLIVL